jgi:DNA repair exonuclease SbcCD nuclease subunit
MKLIFSDLHLDLWRAFDQPTADGLGSRLSMQRMVAEEVYNIGVKNDVDGFYFLGDLFHSKADKISKLVMMEASRIIRKMSEWAPIYIICGNHDTYQGSPVISYLLSEDVYPVVTTTEDRIYDRTVYLVPYGGMMPSNPEPSSVLFGHYGIRGASTNGYRPLDNLDVAVADLIKYKLAIMGHYHTRQALAKNVLHCGAVMANDFNDSNEDRGVHLLDKNFNLKFVPIESPKFYTYRVDTQEHLNKALASINSLNYHKIVITSDGVEVPKQQDNVIYEWDIYNSPDKHVPLDEAQKTLTMDVTDFIMKSNTALNKDKLIEVAHRVLEKL